MIDKKQLIEELLECVKDATDTETQITGLSMCAILMNEVLDEALTIPVVSQRSELCEGNCGMNYCDENGCVDNKPDVGEPKPPEHCG
tara:strand:+ start:524 stop:784 length:261 start_codon:yes stop_codon:yes gene_type:complete